METSAHQVFPEEFAQTLESVFPNPLAQNTTLLALTTNSVQTQILAHLILIPMDQNAYPEGALAEQTKKLLSQQIAELNIVLN